VSAAFESRRFEPLPEEPARAAEAAARWVFAAALCALIYALWAPHLELAATWTEKFVRVLPRMSVFAAAALAALIVQGGRPGSKLLLIGGGMLLLVQILLLPLADLTQPLPNPSPGGIARMRTEAADPLRPYAETLQSAYSSGARDLLLAGAFMDLFRFELSVLSAVLLGTWLGNGLKTGGHFLTLLLCAISGDVWLSYFRVPETAGTQNVLSLLRVPWPPALGLMGLSPAWTDLLFLSAIVAAARRLGFHMLSVVLGAVAGYCGASFLALGPWPAWPALSMSMCASGILMGSWPDLKCSWRESAKAVVIAGALFIVLMGSALVQKRMSPPPEIRDENLGRYRNVT